MARDPFAGMSDAARQVARQPAGYVASVARRKQDRHKASRTYSIRLPEDQAAELERRAAGEGVTGNAWIKALVEGALADG